jgi:spore germination protein GerM
LTVALAALSLACGGDRKAQARPAATPPPAEAAATTPADDAAPLEKSTVTIYFPSATEDGLAAEKREIVETKGAADRGAQILAALLEGPTSEGALPAVPAGTTLRKLWVRDDGSAYADFSEELTSGSNGGSADEILTVYAIVDSLAANIPAIRRVGILVAGRERDTFGHLDLRRPLIPDLTLAPQAKATE